MKKIYVVSPAFHKTGGTELAHQLVKFYCERGIECKIAYFGVKEESNPVNAAFQEYICSWCRAEEIPDSNDTVVVVPEIYTGFLLGFKNAIKVIWWMSVDNFELRNGFHGVAFSISNHTDLLVALKILFVGKAKSQMKSVRYADFHLYQSEYARLHLEKLQLCNQYCLSDYINDKFSEEYNEINRKNYVLYNPAKGFKYTQKLIKAHSEIEWIPIKGLTTEQVAQLLRSSKVYIDFGNHPGKDRFPREAVASGCCLITGLGGQHKML